MIVFNLSGLALEHPGVGNYMTRQIIQKHLPVVELAFVLTKVVTTSIHANPLAWDFGNSAAGDTLLGGAGSRRICFSGQELKTVYLFEPRQR